MALKPSLLLLLASTALRAAAQAGGWYVVDETLACTSTCDINNKCNIVGGPSDSDIAAFCKQITDDCADGVLSDGQRSFPYGVNGLLGTNAFGTGSANGNNGCPNNDDCNQSFKYLALNMRYPSAPGHPSTYCESASIEVNGYYNHAKTGALIVKLPSVRRAGPGKA
jgi:hypothetical protein